MAKEKSVSKAPKDGAKCPAYTLDTQKGLCQTFLNEENSVIVEPLTLC